MKKKYMNPTTIVVNIQTSQMIAVSGFDEELGSTEKNGSASLSRRSYDFWDDEEFDEDYDY